MPLELNYLLRSFITEENIRNMSFGLVWFFHFLYRWTIALPHTILVWTWDKPIVVRRRKLFCRTKDMRNECGNVYAHSISILFSSFFFFILKKVYTLKPRKFLQRWSNLHLSHMLAIFRYSKRHTLIEDWAGHQEQLITKGKDIMVWFGLYTYCLIYIYVALHIYAVPHTILVCN